MGDRDKRERYRSRAELNRGDYRGDFGPEGVRHFEGRDQRHSNTHRREPYAGAVRRDERWDNRDDDRTADAWRRHRDDQEGWRPERPYGSEFDSWSAGAGFRPAGFGFGPEEGQGPRGVADEDWQVTRPARGHGRWAGDWEDAGAMRNRHLRGDREDYRGRGPKGYRRADDRISDEVCERLTDDWSVDATDISVSVQDGEVTLSGLVPSREQKRRAEECIEHVSGVRDVINQLRVSREGAAERRGASETPSVAADAGNWEADSRKRDR